MEVLYLFATMAGLSHLAVDGRAVNISVSWFLPEDGFPVFYRYFDDKVTWDEAYAACGSHQADLLSVQTTAQMDAARAYLKEIDSADNVWIGLLREPSDETFSWTNGEKLLGDGYWVEQIPRSSEKLCVAMDPAADFRWSSHYCRGPKVASFVCELSVPEWTKKENGCLTSPLPSLTITFVPEAAVIQLLSDCGLDGTRRIACNQKTNRQDIIKHLSCDVDAFASTVPAGSSTAGAPRQSNNRVSPHDITRSYRPLTRHRRSAPPTSPISPHTPPQNQTTPPTDDPSSQPPTSDTNAPPTSPPLPSTGNPPVYKPLPVLLITDDDPPPDNGSLPLPAPDNPPIVLMIDNQNLDGPFLFPLADDIIINNPSLSPLRVISVDLVEVDNLAANNTDNLTTPVTPPPPPAPIKLPSNSPLPPTTPRPTIGAAEENPQDDKTDVPQRRSKGRLFDHLTRFSYPRLLNRVLG